MLVIVGKHLDQSVKRRTMNTVDRIVNEISLNLANAIVEVTKYKVLYEEANEENQRVNELLSKFNSVLDSDTALKDLFDEASKKLAALEATRASMEKHIADLQKTQEELKTGIIHLREGTILFQVDQLLAQAVVRNGLSPNEARDAVNSIVEDTNKLVLRRLGVEDHGESVVYVDRQNIEVAISKIEESKTPMVIQVVAAGNIIAGEPAVATIHVYPQQFIYKSGDVIATSVIDGGSNAQVNMLRFLKQVNEEAKSKGVIPDSLSGDIGTIPGDELFSAIRRISMLHGKVYVEAYADGDTYSSGPVHIKLRITQMTDTGKLIKSN